MEPRNPPSKTSITLRKPAGTALKPSTTLNKPTTSMTKPPSTLSKAPVKTTTATPSTTSTTFKKTMTTTSTANTTGTKSFLKKTTEPKGAYMSSLIKNKKRSLLESTSFYMWEEILIFCVDSLESLVTYARVCKLFYRAIFERAKVMNFYLYRFYQKDLKENPAVSSALEEKKYDMDMIIEFIQGCEMVKDKKKTQYFVENYLKMFEYGHVKENVLNKLIERLNIRIDIAWNKKRPYYALYQDNFPFKIKYQNNMSHIILRVDDIKKILIQDLSVLDLVITFRSRYLRRSIELDFQIKKDDIYDASNRKSTKVFHYLPLKNLLFVYFDNDTKVQYMLCEISILEVITRLYNVMRSKVSKAPKVKRIAAPVGISLYEYVRQQLDFEVHFCVKNHNSMRYYFINTTSFPKHYDEEVANFRIPVNASFTLKGADFKLDDELGINQVIKDFFLVDFVLKDKDNILFVYSGFMDLKQLSVTECQKYIENNMNYSEDWFTHIAFEYKTPHYSYFVTGTKDAKQNDILIHDIFIDIKRSILENVH